MPTFAWMCCSPKAEHDDSDYVTVYANAWDDEIQSFPSREWSGRFSETRADAMMASILSEEYLFDDESPCDAEKIICAMQPRTSAKPSFPKVPALVFGAAQKPDTMLHTRDSLDAPRDHFTPREASISCHINQASQTGKMLVTPRKGSFNERPSRAASPSVSTCSGSFSRGTSPSSSLDQGSRCVSPSPQLIRQNSRTRNSETDSFRHSELSSTSRSRLSRPPLPGLRKEHCTNMFDENDIVSQTITLGDVLYVPGSGGGLAEIGTAGGFMGHFMVVLARPHKISAGTHEYTTLKAVWPVGEQEVWRFSVLESTRAIAGLNEVDLLIKLDRNSGKFILFGEIGADGILSLIEDEVFELWQSPLRLRKGLRPDLIRGVVSDMKLCCGSWSITTAARALFRDARKFSSTDKWELLSEITTCWGADPICTSVVITFWQRYLCKLAESLEGSRHQSDLILEFMPLKADRGLPGDLLQALSESGWTKISKLPISLCMHRARSASWNRQSGGAVDIVMTHRSSA